MSLTSPQLVGYLRAEFEKAAKLRVWLFFIQFAVAVPAAISVVVPDSSQVTLYVLAIVGTALLVLWCYINSLYLKARAAGHAARRAALLLGGLNGSFSAKEIQTLRERFTVSVAQAESFEKADYYATRLHPGPGRLAEMLEESALYSEQLQRASAQVMLGIVVCFTFIFLVIALLATPFVEHGTSLVVIRIFLAMLVFGLSSDVLGAYQAHRDAAAEIKAIRERLSSADLIGYPLPDVLLTMADYNTAVEGAPESVPWAYKLHATSLDERWRQYQKDREAVRKQRARK